MDMLILVSAAEHLTNQIINITCKLLQLLLELSSYTTLVQHSAKSYTHAHIHAHTCTHTHICIPLVLVDQASHLLQVNPLDPARSHDVITRFAQGVK